LRSTPSSSKKAKATREMSTAGGMLRRGREFR
jgi:hypothetical protein